MITCPSCKSPIDVPADHDAETIRCGICWAEVEVGIRELQPVEVVAEDEDEVEVLAEAKPDPFVSIPGRPAPGMAPLENLLRNVHERLPQLFTPAKVKQAKRIEAPAPAAESHRPAARRVEEEGLRRKRGATQSSFVIEKEKAKEAAASSPKVPLVVGILVAVAVFVAAFLAFRYLF